MARKTSQAAKKDPTVESKSEGGTTRRSGRAAATPSKPESNKEVIRARRSSTAAQTAASVADSKTPKSAPRSRRDSTSPSDGRQKSQRGNVESPATRVKSTRRSTSRINYKESDGEEETTTAPKFDENFESNEELEDSESDEKNKPKGKTKVAKSPAKKSKSKDKPKGGRGRRGRRSKKESSDEDEPIELSEESVEIESETIGKKDEESPKETTRSGRGRKSRTDIETKSEEKPKSSRRSARASSVKESPKKRPSRTLQAKKYTEDDEDDDIEEIHDSKADEESKPQESGRKRKRGSTTETNKRQKEEVIDAPEKDDSAAETADKDEDSKPIADSECDVEKEESAEESMEVETLADNNAADDKNSSVEKEENKETKESIKEEKSESKKEKQTGETSAEKLDCTSKQDSVDSCENLDDSFDSDQGEEHSVSSGLEDSRDAKDTKVNETVTSQETSTAEKSKTQDSHVDSPNSVQEINESSESRSLNETDINNDYKNESTAEKKETNVDLKTGNSEENVQNANVQQNSQVESDKAVVTPAAPSSVLVATSHSKESNSDRPINGSENVPNSGHLIHGTSAKPLNAEDSIPKANGAHDSHNSVPESNQYYPFPGRKYVINAKLGDSIRQSVKDKSFGFVSYNLGIASSDSSIQKEKLLNELNKLDAHIICMQQVSKPFYCSILEPSLDALGFKGTFSQPEESEKGMATFYKSSLFRLSGQSEASLNHLIEKEIEASSLDANDRVAVKTHVQKCGHVLFTHFATVIGMHSLTVANVQVPPTDISIHALQVSCIVKEAVKVNGGTSRPFLLGGEFNVLESEAPYQLLRDGYLSNDKIEELQRRKDVALPEKENAALVNLLFKSFQHPSSTLCSCYKSVLDHEIFIPEQKSTSRDLLWYSSDSLYTIGVLDASETLSDPHFSLKADIAFSV